MEKSWDVSQSGKETAVKFWKPVVGGSTVLAALILSGPVSCTKAAKHDHSAHDRPGDSAMSDHSPATAAPAARNYADAIEQLRTRMTSLDAIVKSGEYDDVHKDSVAIGKLCGSLGAMAAAPNSSVPRDKVTEVTAAATELSAAARSFHSAAHDEDLPQVKAHYAHMSRLVHSLAAYVEK